MTEFNRILESFDAEYRQPEFAAAASDLGALVERLAALGGALRHDSQRVWENVHVRLEVDRLAASREPLRILDVGGGNSPLAVSLAEAGHRVTVLDVDPSAVESVDANAARLGITERLRAVQGGGGAWPFDPAAFDLVLCVSVFEGLLRSRRPAFFAEIRRVLAPGASLLMTLDFGPGARFLGDAPEDLDELRRLVIDASGLALVGPPPPEPRFDPSIGPPVKALVPTVAGHDLRVAAYSFCALHLMREEQP